MHFSASYTTGPSGVFLRAPTGHTEAQVGTVKARMFHAREKLRQFLPTLAGVDPTFLEGLSP